MTEPITERVKEATRILVDEHGTERYCHAGKLMLAIYGYTCDETEQAVALWRKWKREMSKAAKAR
jgi:hypothetical protein